MYLTCGLQAVIDVIGFYKDSQQHNEAIWNKLTHAQTGSTSQRRPSVQQSPSTFSIASTSTNYPEKRFESPRAPPTPPTNSIHSLRMQKGHDDNRSERTSHETPRKPIDKVRLFIRLQVLDYFFFNITILILTHAWSIMHLINRWLP